MTRTKKQNNIKLYDATMDEDVIDYFTDMSDKECEKVMYYVLGNTKLTKSLYPKLDIEVGARQKNTKKTNIILILKAD